MWCCGDVIVVMFCDTVNVVVVMMLLLSSLPLYYARWRLLIYYLS